MKLIRKIFIRRSKRQRQRRRRKKNRKGFKWLNFAIDLLYKSNFCIIIIRLLFVNCCAVVYWLWNLPTVFRRCENVVCWYSLRLLLLLYDEKLKKKRKKAKKKKFPQKSTYGKVTIFLASSIHPSIRPPLCCGSLALVIVIVVVFFVFECVVLYNLLLIQQIDFFVFL